MAQITPHQSLLVLTNVMQNVMPIKLNIKQAAGKLFLRWYSTSKFRVLIPHFSSVYIISLISDESICLGVLWRV